MKIRYKISILMALLAVAIIVLINISYVWLVTQATDEYITRFLPHEVTSAFLDVPSESEIDWDDMQRQLDRAIEEFSDLLYIVVYSADTDEPKLISMELDRIIPLLTGNIDAETPRAIVAALDRGDVSIEDARTMRIAANPDAPRIAIGYMFPMLDQMRSFIIWIALILILIFTAIAIIISFLLAGGITKSIRQLSSAMKEAADGNLDTSVRVRSRDEVGDLARAFNSMIYQLKEKTSELEQFNRTLEERVERGVAELRRRDEAERQRLISEIQRAREVQMGLFPKSPPDVSGFDIWGICHPATEVGGDYFDYLKLGNGRSCIALGDVSGKGLKGAMNATMAHGMLHAHTRIYSSASETITELNEDLCLMFEETTFTTLSLAFVDSETRDVRLTNAGNPYPVLLRNGRTSLLELSGMPLGIISKIEYDETELTLMPGDALILYSDGISEATTSDERMYGMDRLTELVESIPPELDARSIVEKILQDVRQFVGDFAQSDDMTVIALRVRETP